MVFGFLRRLFGFDHLIWQIAYYDGRRHTKTPLDSLIAFPTKREQSIYDYGYEEGVKDKENEDAMSR